MRPVIVSTQLGGLRVKALSNLISTGRKGANGCGKRVMSTFVEVRALVATLEEINFGIKQCNLISAILKCCCSRGRSDCSVKVMSRRVLREDEDCSTFYQHVHLSCSWRYYLTNSDLSYHPSLLFFAFLCLRLHNKTTTLSLATNPVATSNTWW